MNRKQYDFYQTPSYNWKLIYVCIENHDYNVFSLFLTILLCCKYRFNPLNLNLAVVYWYLKFPF